MSKYFPMQMQVDAGQLRYEDGSEVVLWGSNFQPNLYWEYKFRMEHMGIPMTSEVMKLMCDDGFMDLKKMGFDVIRCHLSPSDFTDSEGNLVENIWLDLLGYMISEARKNDIYVYITFINQMEYGFIENSFINRYSREDWIFNSECVKKIEKMVHQLLNWANPYNGIQFKNDKTVCILELINEPEYLTYDQMINNDFYKTEFSLWVDQNGGAFNDYYFSKYRYTKVKQFINSLYQLIREEGARQPVVWNCNWPRMIDSRRDVFSAIADSHAEVVSFCLYPGQDEVGDPFIENPADTSGKNYLPFLKHCFDDYDHLGWLKSEAFSKKAKCVYEFETMYNNTNSYIHTAMAKLFRALGVQIAASWTHCFNVYSSHMGCAHNLNLKTTPKKAAGFIVASRVFRLLPCNFEFNSSNLESDISDQYALSFDHDVSMVCCGDELVYSGNLDWCPIDLPSLPKKIIGYGDSPFVTCNSTGLYFIDVGKDSVQVELLPQAQFVREAWRWHADGELVTYLDNEKPISFSLKLPGWQDILLKEVPGLFEIPLEQQPI